LSKLEVLFASTNLGKLQEVRELARQFSVTVLGLSDVTGVSATVPEVEENGQTYQANAFLKAEAYFAWSGMATIADDTGLEVRALAGSPGVLSARYAGANATGRENKQLLLKNMQEKKDRRALFVCELVFILEPSKVYVARGELMGEITREESGNGGFGYDSIFRLPDFDCTLAEAKERRLAVKTHRECALERLFLQKLS
jgi:XTP/dITP diphosphohydrolase